MSLTAGTKLGPYEILAQLGAGGMGEVYRARDTRLDRTVAIKILPQHLSSSALRERFEREGRAVASLNHPHICTLYDVGQQDEIDYLVMECLEGETLAERLKRGPLPVDQALRYGIQIADALDRAHRQGVLHRDLKPANIMLTKDGAKVLDFGLAKVESRHPLPQGATQTMALTSEGTIMGTFQYMAPEQLEGKEADPRADIFAFGAVLYEMLTGQKAFEGKSQASLISAIMSFDPPPVFTLQPDPGGAPLPGLDHVVKQCISKDVDRRWQTARDVMLELQWIAGGGSQSAVPAAVGARVRSWERLAWAGGLLLLLAAAIFLAVGRFSSSPQPIPVVRAPLLPPSEASFLSAISNFVVSPDGSRVVFVAAGEDGKTTLWLRALSASSAQQLKGTEGATPLPFFSADSRRIAFFAEDNLKTLDIEGGAVKVLCSARSYQSGTWSRDGTIVFAPAPTGPLYRIPDAGGAPAPITVIRRQGSGQRHRFPFFLPDGKHFLYTVDSSSPDDPQSNGIYVGSLDSSAPKLISSDLTGNVAFASAHLLYIRGRLLIAQPFDAGRLQTTGPPVSIAEEVHTDLQGRSSFSASENGVLVYQSVAEFASRLTWFDAGGKELDPIPGPGFRYPRFSPDGRSLVVSSDDARDGKYYIRVYDLARGISTRLTDSGSDTCPVWSTNGKEITYASRDSNIAGIYQIRADGSGSPRMLLKGKMIPNDWSRDGNLVLMDFTKGPPVLAIYAARDRSVTPFAGESEAQFSPDGKWITYAGPRGHLGGEIFVQPFSGPSRRLQVSVAGGGQPRWSRDGKQIFYITSNKKLMAVTFDPGRMTASAPRVLFQTRIVAPTHDFYQYDVAPDGRFLINSLPSNYSTPLTLLTGWTGLLKGH